MATQKKHLTGHPLMLGGTSGIDSLMLGGISGIDKMGTGS